MSVSLLLPLIILSLQSQATALTRVRIPMSGGAELDIHMKLSAGCTALLHQRMPGARAVPGFINAVTVTMLFALSLARCLCHEVWLQSYGSTQRCFGRLYNTAATSCRIAMTAFAEDESEQFPFFPSL